MPHLYILDPHNRVVPVDNPLHWVSHPSFMKRVGYVSINGVEISTVFIGIDFLNEEEPQVFETMTFGGKFKYRQMRCSTWKRALDMHMNMCANVRRDQREQ